MTQIAVIENGYVRDTQIFTTYPEIIGEGTDWEYHFANIKCFGVAAGGGSYGGH